MGCGMSSVGETNIIVRCDRKFKRRVKELAVAGGYGNVSFLIRSMLVMALREHERRHSGLPPSSSMHDFDAAGAEAVENADYISLMGKSLDARK